MSGSQAEMTDRLFALGAVTVAAVPMWLLDLGTGAAALTALVVAAGALWRVYRNLVGAVQGIVRDEIRPLRDAVEACDVDLRQIKQRLADQG